MRGTLDAPSVYGSLLMGEGALRTSPSNYRGARSGNISSSRTLPAWELASLETSTILRPLATVRKAVDEQQQQEQQQRLQQQSSCSSRRCSNRTDQVEEETRST